MKHGGLKITIVAALMLGGCAQIHQHKGVVLDSQLIGAIQPGVDNNGNPVTVFTYAYSTTVTVTFNDYSFSPEGTIDLSATYQCQRGTTDCPGQGNNTDRPPATSCATTLPFVGRLIDAQAITPYVNDPASGEPQ
jgi:hypothetical protein